MLFLTIRKNVTQIKGRKAVCIKPSLKLWMKDINKADIKAEKLKKRDYIECER